MKRPKISLVTLGVTDLARATRFYEDGLGFPRRAFDSEEVRFFDLDGAWLGLFGREALAEDAGVPAVGSGFAGVTIARNLSSREDVDVFLARARDAGATCPKPAEEKAWGGYSGYFADLDGHLWEAAWNPGFDLT